MKKVLLSLMAVSFILTACEDEFTEKDLLEAQQSVGYSVRLVNVTEDAFSDNYAVAGVTVTLTQGGSTFTATTNADGFALFPQVKLGDVYYSIKSDKYYRIEGRDHIEAGSREAQVSGGTIFVLPKDGENVATVEGTVNIDIDQTTPELEVLTKGIIKFIPMMEMDADFEPIIANIDSEGNYSIELPIGVPFRASAPQLLLDQKRSVYNGDTGEYEDKQVPTKFYFEADDFSFSLVEGETKILNARYEEYF